MTPSMERGPPKKRKQPPVVAWNDEMTMTDDNLKAMSVPPERPAGQSSVVVPLPRRPRVPRLRLLVRRLHGDIGDKVERILPG